jgi:hypothetical protein
MTGNLIGIPINDTKIVRLHKPLTDARGCTNDTVFVDSARDITIICRRKTTIVEPATDVANFFFNLVKIWYYWASHGAFLSCLSV